jgi:hypothetical protein
MTRARSPNKQTIVRVLSEKCGGFMTEMAFLRKMWRFCGDRLAPSGHDPGTKCGTRLRQGIAALECGTGLTCGDCGTGLRHGTAAIFPVRV